MAINPQDPSARERLQRAVRRAYTERTEARSTRKNLRKIYEDIDDYTLELFDNDSTDLGTLLNLFQKYVRGHLLSLAHFSPKWAINARTKAGRGFDKRIQQFLNRYMEILHFDAIQSQLALDSAFGWAVAKIDNGIAPKGITAPVAPRVYRIDPDQLILDQTAATFEECSFIGDTYLVPLDEAKAYEGFDPEEAQNIYEYRFESGTSQIPDSLSTYDAFAEPMARLVDIYIPKQGKIYTWQAPNDEFQHVTQEPLGVRDTHINPYSVLSLLSVPGRVTEISRLSSLRGLHLLANEMMDKGVQQARASQRNPVGPLGAQQDMETALNAGDNNPIFLDDKDQLGIYAIPGPDPSILNLGSSAAAMFSQEAGNLEVALGASTGADTARQTEALLGQISASQSIDRRAFEMFLADIGMKLASLAFKDETLELETVSKVPGTKLEYSSLWAPASQMPRAAEVDTFHFDVVPYSTSFRTPQERLGQLQQASQLAMQWMQAAAQGAPINIEAVMKSTQEAFDLIPELEDWFSGDPPPTPAERTANTYQSLAAPSSGSDVRYHGSDGGGGQQGAPEPQDTGGVQ